MSTDPIATACRLHEQATLHHQRQRLDRAETLCRRSLRLLQRAVGSDHPDVANVLTALAGILDDQGRYPEAERCARRSMRALRSAPDEPDVQRLRVQAAQRLANILRAQGRYQQAELLYRRALTLAKKALGPEDLDTAGVLNDLGVLSKYTGRFGRAARLYRRALARRSTTTSAGWSMPGAATLAASRSPGGRWRFGPG